jgi:hypothetical protein
MKMASGYRKGNSAGVNKGGWISDREHLLSDCGAAFVRLKRSLSVEDQPQMNAVSTFLHPLSLLTIFIAMASGNIVANPSTSQPGHVVVNIPVHTNPATQTTAKREFIINCFVTKNSAQNLLVPGIGGRYRRKVGIATTAQKVASRRYLRDNKTRTCKTPSFSLPRSLPTSHVYNV